MRFSALFFHSSHEPHKPHSLFCERNRSFFSNSRVSNSRIVNLRGFTLIEVIIGIVVFSISLSIVSVLIIPAEEKSADQVLQVKAAELGQSLLNDISSRAFDENSDMAGGLVRCGEPLNSNLCTDEGDFGSDSPGEDSNDRSSFDDVDDFHGYTLHLNANNQNLHQGYTNFDLLVEVTYDGLSIGLANNDAAKKITVTVTTPLGTEIKFATHKANF